jgi:hypothetical protein
MALHACPLPLSGNCILVKEELLFEIEFACMHAGLKDLLW